MPTTIPEDRIQALLKAGVCNAAWLLTEPRPTYEDLAEHPEAAKWAFIAARLPGADVARLQVIVDAKGTDEQKAQFRRHVRGATP